MKWNVAEIQAFYPCCALWDCYTSKTLLGLDFVQKVRKNNLTDARLSSELCKLKIEVQKSRLLGFGKWAASQRVLAGDEEAAVLHAVSGKCRNSSYVISSPLQQILAGRQRCGKMASVIAQEGQTCQGSWALQPSKLYLSDSSRKDAHNILKRTLQN